MVEYENIESLPREKLIELVQIYHLDIHVVDHCNLSCKACGHFSCLVEKPVFYDIDRLAGSLAKLAELVPNICRFGVVGGEPLLHPDLAAILDLIHDRFPFAQILMSTNGLLLSQMPDALIDAIKANHVCVGLSLYPPMHDEIDGIVALLKEMGFDYCVMRVDSFERRFLPRPVFNKQQMFDKCGHIMCLRGSRVGYCVNALFTDYYNKRFGKDLLPEDSGVDMFIYADGKSFLEALHQPLDLCRQCVACDTGKQYFRAWALAGKTPRAEDWFIDFPFEAALARNGE